MTMNIDTLYENLKKIQEPKGYFFNRNKDLVHELLESLMKNKERYGYMVCPCRLASGEREADKDIICPCHYREADVLEFGACFCGLYISKESCEDKVVPQYVPERRPPEKMF